MVKLKYSDDIFLNDIVSLLRSGLNLEQAFFEIEYMPQEILFDIQIGKPLLESVQLIEFQYPVVKELFASIISSDIEEILHKISITAQLIKKRNEVIREKESLFSIHRRRMTIIRYITLVTIAIIAGMSPLFTGLFSLLTNGILNYQFSILTPLSISFLIINILNNYFLLRISYASKIQLQLVIATIVHLIIVSIIYSLFSSYTNQII